MFSIATVFRKIYLLIKIKSFITLRRSNVVMKLYCSYSRKEWIGFGLTLLIMSVVTYVPVFYFVDDLYIPFSNASTEFLKFAVEDGFLDRWVNYYSENQTLSNLDKSSFMLFNVFTLIGGVLVSALILFLFVMIIPQVVLVTCKRIGLYSKNPLKISRKPFVNES